MTKDNACKVIAVVAQKGGCGKTSLTLNLGAGLTQMGYKVCLVDADPNANLTMALGYPRPEELAVTLPDAMREVIRVGGGPSPMLDGDTFLLTAQGMDFIPSNKKLAGLESVLVSTMSRETVLKRLLSGFKNDYDYLLIDCAPSLNIVALNALTAADKVLIPTQPQFFSAKGLELLLSTIVEVKGSLNHGLAIEGVVFTMYDRRLRFHREVLDTISTAYGDYMRIFGTKIPVSVRMTESQAGGLSILDHDPRGKVANAYRALAEEVAGYE